jgi:hypothetical protein
MVVNGIRRLTQAAQQPPNFEALRGTLGLGHDDLVTELAEAKQEGVVSEDAGRFSVSGEEPEHQIETVEAPIPDALLPEEEQQVRANPDPGLDVPAVAQNGTGELADEDHAARRAPMPDPGAPPRPVQEVVLTAGMVQSLDENALGGLVKAGIEEARRVRRPFLLRVE